MSTIFARRDFLKRLLGTAAGAAALATVDVDKLLWRPEDRTILLPPVHPLIGSLEDLHPDERTFISDVLTQAQWDFKAAMQTAERGRYVVTTRDERVIFDKNWHPLQGHAVADDGIVRAMSDGELALLAPDAVRAYASAYGLDGRKLDRERYRELIGGRRGGKTFSPFAADAASVPYGYRRADGHRADGVMATKPITFEVPKAEPQPLRTSGDERQRAVDALLRKDRV